MSSISEATSRQHSPLAGAGGNAFLPARALVPQSLLNSLSDGSGLDDPYLGVGALPR